MKIDLLMGKKIAYKIFGSDRQGISLCCQEWQVRMKNVIKPVRDLCNSLIIPIFVKKNQNISDHLERVTAMSRYYLCLLLGCLLMSVRFGQAQTPVVDSLNLLLDNPSLEKKEQFQLWNQLGLEYEQQYNAVEAARAYEEAIRVGRNQTDLQDFTKALFRYGQMNIYSGNYQKAISALFEALSISKKQQYKELEGRVLTSLGILHFFQEEWDDALYYYRQALLIAEDIKNPQGISIIYNNIANIYQRKEDLSTALTYYEKALEIQRSILDSAAIGNCLMNIGTIQLARQEISSCILSMQEALKIASAIGDKEIEALSYMNLGQVYARQGAYRQGIEMLHKGEKIAAETGYKQVLQAILASSSELYRETGDYKMAFEQLLRSRHLGDSLMNQQLKEKTREFDIQYKTAEKDIELAIQRKDLKIARTTYILLSIISLLLVFIIIFLIYSARERRKRNKRLAELNVTKDKLFSIISHDLKSPVIAQKLAIEHLLENIDTYDREGLLHLILDFRQSTETQLGLLLNLLSWARLQIGQIKYHPVVFDLSDVVKEVLNLYSLPARNKQILFVNRITEPCIVIADRAMIHTVLRNLINNAIKFTCVGKSVVIDRRSENGLAVVSVKDSGVGMSAEQINTILNTRQQTFSTNGTQGEKGSGLGLILCRDLLELNHSQMYISSKITSGTEVFFGLPVPEK